MTKGLTLLPATLPRLLPALLLTAAAGGQGVAVSASLGAKPPQMRLVTTTTVPLGGSPYVTVQGDGGVLARYPSSAR